MKNLKLVAMMVMICSSASLAAIDVKAFDSAEQETRYHALINDFRCPTCQNQNLAGSDAPIANDLKQKTFEMIKAGRTDSEIRAFMHERYGDFISYKPPMRPSTWILWFFPPLLLVVVLVGWVWRARHKTLTAQAQDSLSEQEEQELAALLSRYNSQNQEDKT